jgi:hypothetical protein
MDLEAAIQKDDGSVWMVASMTQYVLSLDQGTTSSRAMLFDHEGKIAGSPSTNSSSISRRPDGSSTTPWIFSRRS